MATDERVLQKELRLTVGDLIGKIDNSLGARKRGIDYLNNHLALRDGKLWWQIKMGCTISAAKKKCIHQNKNFNGIYRWEISNELSLDQLKDLKNQLIDICESYL